MPPPRATRPAPRCFQVAGERPAVGPPVASARPLATRVRKASCWQPARQPAQRRRAVRIVPRRSRRTRSSHRRQPPPARRLYRPNVPGPTCTALRRRCAASRPGRRFPTSPRAASGGDSRAADRILGGRYARTSRSSAATESQTARCAGFPSAIRRRRCCRTRTFPGRPRISSFARPKDSPTPCRRARNRADNSPKRARLKPRIQERGGPTRGPPPRALVNREIHASLPQSVDECSQQGSLPWKIPCELPFGQVDDLIQRNRFSMRATCATLRSSNADRGSCSRNWRNAQSGGVGGRRRENKFHDECRSVRRQTLELVRQHHERRGIAELIS